MSISCVTNLDAAVEFVSLGIPIIPLHYPIIENGQVSCSCNRDEPCKIGKHPKWIKGLTEHGVNSPLTSKDQVHEAWNRYPQANIGLITGRPSVIFIIDIDPKNGGHFSYDKLKLGLGELPDACLVYTGRYEEERGRHFYLRFPGGKLDTRIEKLMPGIDVISDGGYVVAPPSLHESGVQYKFAHGSKCLFNEIPKCPNQWLERMDELGIWLREWTPVEDTRIDNEACTNNTSPSCTNITSPNPNYCSNSIENLDVLDQPWAKHLLWHRIALDGNTWGKVVFPVRKQDESGHSFELAQKLTGHLVRYGATKSEARAIVEFITRSAVTDGRYPDNSTTGSRSPSEFIKTVMSFFGSAMKSQDGKSLAADYGFWRYGTTVWFNKDFVDRLKGMLPHYAAMMYAVEVMAGLNPDSEADLAMSHLIGWATCATGYKVVKSKAQWFLKKYRNSTRGRSAYLVLVSKGNYPQNDNVYSGGKLTGDRYLINRIGAGSQDLTHRKVESLMGWPSLFQYCRHWIK